MSVFRESISGSPWCRMDGMTHFPPDRCVSLHIAVDNVDQLFGRSLLPGFRPFILVQNVTPDMALEQLRHETVQSSAASRDLLQDFMAIGFFAERTFNRFHLPLDPADAPDQVRLIACCMCQNGLRLYSPPV